MAASYKKKRFQRSQQNVGNKLKSKWKSCPQCFVKHYKKDCPCKQFSCHKCGKKGHIKSVCQSPQTSSEQTHAVESAGSVYSDFMSPSEIAQVSTSVYKRFGNQIWIRAAVNDNKMLFQWDTGSTCSMVGLNGYRRLGSPPCEPLNKTLRAYGERPLQIKGKCTVTVKVGNMEQRNLNLIVVNEENGSNLLGLDWSDRFGLTKGGLTSISDDSQVEEAVCSTRLFDKSMLKQKVDGFISLYSNVFTSNLGRCTKFKVPLHLKPNAKIVFHKPRPIPFARREAVKLEIDRLVERGVLEQINYSDWAAPIVAVSKPDGRVRICGDFKGLNQQLQID